MPLQQFDETSPVAPSSKLTSAYVPPTRVAVSNQPATRFRVDVVLASNTDVAAHVLSLGYFRGGSITIIGSVAVPAGAGTAGAPAVMPLATLLPSVATGIVFADGDLLYIWLDTAPAGAAELDVLCLGGYV